MPLWHPVSISGYHIREAGSTAAQELAFTLADGFAYVEAAMARGLAVDDFAPRLVLLQRAHRLLRGDREVPRGAADLGARAPGALRGQEPALVADALPRPDGRRALTAQQPEVNIVRTAVEALAAVLGGCQSLHTNSFDEALALPTEHAVKIAPHATGAGARDGVGLDDRPARRLLLPRGPDQPARGGGLRLLRRIRALGGVVPAIKENFFQREIAEASFRFQSELEAGQR